MSLSLRKVSAELSRQLAVALLYFGAALVGLRVVAIAGQVSPVWLPTGVALWAFARFGFRALPGLFFGSCAAALTSGAPLAFCVTISAGNVLEGVVAVELWRRLFGLRPELDRVEDVAALVLSAVVSPFLASAVGTAAMIGFGLAPASMWGEVAWVWWLGDAMGAIVVAPLLLTFAWRGVKLQLRPKRLFEVLALTSVLAVSAVVVFGGLIPHQKTLYTQAFLLFPPAAWAALRFGPRGTALATFVISMLALAGTAFGQGPFAYQDVVRGVVVLQLFMAMLVITSQLLAAAFAERKRANSESELLAHAVHHTREGVLIVTLVGPEARILYANAGFSRLTGRDVSSLVGEAPWVCDADQSTVAPRHALLEALVDGGSYLSEWILARADGKRVHTELLVSPIPHGDDGTARFVFVYRDIGERKRFQAQLVLSERMASVGMVAASVGHEINNPLGFVLLNLQMLERELSALKVDPAQTRRSRELLDDTLYGTQRVRDIVRSLRVLSRDSQGDRARVDVNELLELTLGLTRHELRTRGQLEKSFGPVPPVWANEARLGQVVLNLVVNAIQALPETGDKAKQRVTVRTSTTADGLAAIEVADNGVGIPPELSSRIFEPFFTTKPAGVGTGLGLFICRQIVEEHGGSIDVHSEPGVGTTFRVLLPPARSEAADAPRTVSGELPRASSKRTVLIVDDEARLAASMRLLLQPTHAVEVCTDSQRALERLSSGGVFDVVLCDLHMPGLSGIDLWRRLRATRPEVADRMLFVSGATYADDAPELAGELKDRMLEKPVHPDVLLAALDRVVSSGRRPAA